MNFVPVNIDRFSPTVLSAKEGTPSLINLMDLNAADLGAFFSSQGEKTYRGRQVLQWIHQFGQIDFAPMTNISKNLRACLAEQACIILPVCAKTQTSSDGTIKWLFQLQDGNAIETVFIPEERRGTLCVSSQVGCALNCDFCATARQGFSRNLSTGEIIGQVWQAKQLLQATNQKITNVVMMGMGEPLLNFDAVVRAMEIMLDDFGYGLSKRRVTLSTSGVVPAMIKLAKVSDVALAVSLHAPIDSLRDHLVPINKKYNLDALMAACREFFKNEPRRYITFEYVMLDEINDSDEMGKALIKRLRGLSAKVNLIPFNPFPGAPYRCSSMARIDSFRSLLLNAGINTITRKTRGEDIDAACGQLVGDFKDRTRRSQRYATGVEKNAEVV